MFVIKQKKNVDFLIIPGTFRGAKMISFNFILQSTMCASYDIQSGVENYSFDIDITKYPINGTNVTKHFYSQMYKLKL